MNTKNLFLFTILAVVSASNSNQGTKSKISLMQMFGKGKSRIGSNQHKEFAMQGLRVTDCTNGAGKAYVTNVSIEPYPIKIPGTITVKADAIVKTEMEPQKGRYMVYKYFGTFGYVQLPCMEEPCEIYDICNKMNDIEKCPEIITDMGYSCECPIKEGEYTSQEITVTLDDIDTPLAFGDYLVTGQIYDRQSMVACVNIEFKLIHNY